ncbi:MAG: CRISPR-associated endonuclease Cas2 [Candidatus Altiarchaeales archaeon HGW-Altiarchaeales-1]|nr:MAG: CRISPR-associated endonuclease Cas2 [Candidatus Altiarchaeales archaeon HGW-Altiarchaeales-1]
MYAIIVYDVAQERVSKVCQFLRRYLNWVQNSVFEGEITEGQLRAIKIGIGKIIDEEYDCILIYRVESKKWLNKEVMGIEKREVTNIL